MTRYLTIEVLEPADAWFIEHDLGAGIPTDEKNLLLSTALSISIDMPVSYTHLDVYKRQPL